MKLTPFLKSRKTTTAAAMAVFALLIGIGEAGQSIFDSDPDTNIDLNVLGMLILSVANAFGFLAARDADKSSQDSGIRE